MFEPAAGPAKQNVVGTSESAMPVEFLRVGRR